MEKDKPFDIVRDLRIPLDPLSDWEKRQRAWKRNAVEVLAGLNEDQLAGVHAFIDQPGGLDAQADMHELEIFSRRPSGKFFSLVKTRERAQDIARITGQIQFVEQMLKLLVADVKKRREDVAQALDHAATLRIEPLYVVVACSGDWKFGKELFLQTNAKADIVGIAPFTIPFDQQTPTRCTGTIVTTDGKPV